jgi:hypothetical protein
MNRVLILVFTLMAIIPAKQKPTARVGVSIQSDLQITFGFMVLHTWTTV